MLPGAESGRKKKPGTKAGLDLKDLAATYSRGVYKTTTIGKAAFDGRVRDGNGSDHSFMATKKSRRTAAAVAQRHGDPQGRARPVFERTRVL